MIAHDVVEDEGNEGGVYRCLDPWNATRVRFSIHVRLSLGSLYAHLIRSCGSQLADCQVAEDKGRRKLNLRIRHPGLLD